MKRLLIGNKEDKMTILRKCELLGVKRSGYYYTPKPVSEENLNYMRLIDEIYTESPDYGSRQIRDTLRLMGYKVNRKRVQRLMQIMGIEAIYPKKNLSKAAHSHKIYPYLLKGIIINRPNQVWCSDITYIRLSHGFVYLVAVLDWYTKKVLSWELSITLDKYFCISALESAIRLYGKPEIFNTDQGCQFTSDDFTDVLKENQIKISMDGKGRALDNICVERFWRTLKYGEVYLKDYFDVTEAYQGIKSYIEKYNQRRPHSTLNGHTPDKVYNEYFNRKEINWVLKSAQTKLN